MQRLNNFCTFVLVALLAGCGGDNVSLKGKVTFSDDGTPLTQGTVAFLKEGKISKGTIKPDGTYIVGTDKETDGLLPGMYQVFISGSEKAIPVDAEAGIYNYEPQIDKKYESADTSGLSVEVNASAKTFDIKVDRFPGNVSK